MYNVIFSTIKHYINFTNNPIIDSFIWIIILYTSLYISSLIYHSFTSMMNLRFIRSLISSLAMILSSIFLVIIIKIVLFLVNIIL